MRGAAVVVAAVSCTLAVGCKGDADASKTVDQTAHQVGDESCGSCGMVVREQSGPRGQVVHRDGTREFFCSVSDMLTYMEAPSRHGRVVSAYVEAMDPAADPKASDMHEHPWIKAEDAGYVLGVDKPRVMGTPVLAYATRAQAQAAAKRHKGEALDWEQLRRRLRYK